MKKFAILALALALILTMLAGCAPQNGGIVDSSTNPGNTDAASATTPVENGEPITVAAVVAGGLGDRSFYDSAAEGLRRLQADYNVDMKVIECKEDASMYKTQLINAAQTSDFVIAIGWQFYDGLTEVAPEMPDTKFIYVDEAVEGVDNIFNIKYAQNEGSFLAGFIAAKMSATGKIGAVGGMDNDTINDFIVGYKQGAQYANPDISVEVIYAGSYEDPAKGKESALSLYSQGCDVVFQIAGKTGEGVFEAAAERNCYAIGVDSDQKYINPDVIICSMKKEVGDSIYATIENFIKNGEFRGGETWITDMENGFIGIGYGEDSMTQQVSEEIKAEVQELKAKIISGEIVVDTTRE